MKMMRFTCGVVGLGLVLASGPAMAQLAPTPKKSPRTPVSKELIAGRTSPAPPLRTVQGDATVIDAEHLRINDAEVRLFGVVPPQMSASFGPQARSVVDSLAQGTVTCQVKDRTRDGSYLAQCRNEQNADFGIELLRRGLAMTARGSLRSSDYATAYLAAEKAAQSQRLGIWSTSLPAAASESSIREAAIKAEAARAEAEQAKLELARAEAMKAEAQQAAQLAKLEAEAAMAAVPATTLKVSTGENTGKPPLPQLKPDNSAQVEASPTAEDIQIMLSKQPLDAPKIVDERNFFEKYQLLLSGLLLFFTSVCIVIGTIFYKKQQRREDLKSIAAALRGEMMAARSICQARLSKIAHDRTDKDTTWPRIRTTIFQAYVGKLGCLGAELSRKIASIYGMAADYSSYYNTTEARPEAASKKQALESLIHHIEEVSPRLIQIEKEGVLPKSHKPINFGAVLPAPIKPLPIASAPSATPKPPSGGPGKPVTTVSTADNTQTRTTISDVARHMTEAKNEILTETRASRNINQSEKEDEIKAARIKERVAAKEPQKQTTKRVAPATATPATKPTAAAPIKRTATDTKTTRIAPAATKAKVESAAQSALKAVTSINFKAPIFEKLSQLKTLAASQLDFDKKPPTDLDDFTIPDYANLTEEELEALLYAEDELVFASPTNKSKKSG